MEGNLGAWEKKGGWARSDRETPHIGCALSVRVRVTNG